MPVQEIAEQILAAVGGADNVSDCDVSATRLQILVRSMSEVDFEAISSVHGVLGVFSKGRNGIEVVLGPSLTRNVSKAIRVLTGIEADDDKPESTVVNPFDSAASIQISESAAAALAAEIPESELADDEDDDFDDMLETMDGDDDEFVLKRSLLVINGPNINMLGKREPDIYGNETYGQLIELCEQAAKDAGFDECVCVQSNHEGDLVDYIQNALGVHDAIVINPAAYTHTSVALLDALKAVTIPTVEVHISKVDEREEFRQVSYVRKACVKTISGHGFEGYREAIEFLAEYLGI